ncbi:hypothetical protein ATO4_15955 [Aurantimonas sp. 22II-16-19i]|nr:hypothetical protein ATO4_15955 [Aurantimonas sp. 22II-16-19i]
MARAETPRNDFFSSRKFSAVPAPECRASGDPGDAAPVAPTLRQPDGSVGLCAPALSDRAIPPVLDSTAGLAASVTDAPATTMVAITDRAPSLGPMQAFGPIFSSANIRASRWLMATLHRVGTLTLPAAGLTTPDGIYVDSDLVPRLVMVGLIDAIPDEIGMLVSRR